MEAIMLNKGYTETNINNNNHKVSNKLKWSGSYNGENGNLDIETNMNGDHKGIHVEFNNDDLAKLFSMPSSKKTLDQQLRDDFDLTSLRRQQWDPTDEDPQLGKQMIKQIMKEESFPMIISKYDMDLMTPNRRNKHRYIIMTKKNRKRKSKTIKRSKTKSISKSRNR